MNNNFVKKCIFCGLKPVDKNKEHVLPQWLLEFTGDPKRKVRHGFNWQTGAPRSFSANSFVFPACSECNSFYGEHLEPEASKIIKKLCIYEAIQCSDYKILLDWLDKVRIGLWLGYRYLNGNHLGIDPSFHINQRIGIKDRILLCYPYKGEEKGVSYLGPDSPLFSLMPSCLVIRINSIIFINISSDFIVSPRLGYPYPDTAQIQKVGKNYLISKLKKRENVVLPIFPFKFHKPFVYLAQAKATKDTFFLNQEIYKKPPVPGNLHFNGLDIGSDLFDVIDKKRFCSDDEFVNFNEISKTEGKMIWELFYQYFDLQKYLLDNAFFKQELHQDFMKIHNILKHKYKSNFTEEFSKS